MKRPRLVLVTRRFWPLVGGAERQMASLATELKRLGCDVTILTAHWESRWPSEISHHGVRVVRLPNPAVRGWGTMRYMLAIGRWLRDHRGQFDLVYVSTLRHDAYAALCVRDLDVAVPVVLRAEGVRQMGDCHWQDEAHFGHRIAKRCQKADAIVAPSPSVEEELLAAGYTNVTLIDNGVAISETVCTEEQRAVARMDLARANPDLTVADSAPVAVFTGRLHEAKGLDALLAAWPMVIAKRPRARLWLVGEGPLHPKLAAEIERRNLRRRVMLAGTFDDVEQFLRAADLFVLPAREEGTSLALLEAMAAGLPVVTTENRGNRHVIEGEGLAEKGAVEKSVVEKGPTSEVADGPRSESRGPLVPYGEAEPLAQAILQVFNEPEIARQWGAAGRRRVGEAFSIAKMAERHLKLFQRLTSDHQPTDSP